MGTCIIYKMIFFINRYVGANKSLFRSEVLMHFLGQDGGT